MDKFNTDYHANINKATKLKNELAIRNGTGFHQHGTDKHLEQVEYNKHNKIYNWRDTLVPDDEGAEFDNFILGG
jgi:hypothetical protein